MLVTADVVARCWLLFFFFFFLLVAQEFGCSGRRGKTGKAATALLFLAIAERGQGKKSKIQNRQHDESRRKKERNRSAAALVVIAALGTLSGRFTDERKPAKDKKHDGRIHFGRIRQPVALCMQRSAAGLGRSRAFRYNVQLQTSDKVRQARDADFPSQIK